MFEDVRKSKMKKAAALFFCVALMFSFGCGGSKKNEACDAAKKALADMKAKGVPAAALKASQDAVKQQCK